MMMLTKHEIFDLLKNPAILVVIILPIFMSKIIITAMNNAEIGLLLLSIWILFAQVMVGIMLTGPNLIEEREGKTIDALLCSPLSFAQIVIAKGLVILTFSLFSQSFVFFINEGFSRAIIPMLFPMLLGGIIFIQIGIVIGFKINSSKNGSAVSSIIMVTLFLIVSVYEVLPDWTYRIFMFIPSIGIIEVLKNLATYNTVAPLETFLSFAWVFALGSWIGLIGREY
ncbi:ABC transporter permease [Dethiobacter alkaliphilus]|uniref:ABC transporter permease n=1 Tax=Dethiobacter alkaliphilus TaxID=427926 RepID=UPI00222696CF|nr:ABC transporter permease [Dethiobacter alkaliphilus]MCW3490488.1 ABC transporter permease [Dethiobacter alkaliphilus]